MWWTDLGDPVGSAPGFIRPVVVISADPYNRSTIATVTVAAITSNMSLADAPGNVSLAKGSGGLPKPSVVNVTQLVTLDRNRLIERIGTLGSSQLDRLDLGLRQALGL